jgi:TonB-dependent SusC/RagA subfamily outer membrane receptor
MRVLVGISALVMLVGVGNHPLAAQVPEARVAGTGVVSGVVVAEGGAPLQAVSVVTDNGRIGTMTNAEGRFRLAGLPGASGAQISIRAQRVGFRPRTQLVTVGETAVRIEMTELTIQLNQVVVTGTATGGQARAIGTARGEVKVADLIGKSPPPSMQTLVAGNVAGVNISTAPGNIGTGAAIRIRGAGSLSLGNTPIVYVDGVRMDNDQNAAIKGMRGGAVSRFNDLNPDEIESIEVIKGPAAATLFGTEASAGVIQVTTKKGKGGAPTWDLNLRQGRTYLSNPVERWPEVYDRSTLPCEGCVMLPGGIRELNVLKSQMERGYGLPWVNGHNQTYGLGARGGTGPLNYFFSGQSDREEGYVPWNWKNKNSARANLDLTASPSLSVNTAMGFLRSKTRFDASGPFPAEIVSSIYWGTPAAANARSHGWNWTPPEAMETVFTQETYDRYTGSVTVRHNPLSWLTQRLTAGADIGSSVPTRMFPRSPLGSADYFGSLSLGHVEVLNRSVTNTNIDYGAAATFSLPWDLKGETAIGGQFYKKELHEQGATGDRFPAPGPGTVSSAAIKTGFEDFVQNKSLGLYVQQQLNSKNRRFITVALRGDANSAFGANYAQVLFPKVSASWVVHEEDFWNLGWMNALKLRAAWGQAGRQPDVFAARRLYAPFTAAGDSPGLSTDAVGNPNLRPEIGEEIEVGFDASMLDDRLNVRYTNYNKSTKDPILRKPVAPSSGFAGNQFVNAGLLSNKGHELEVDGRMLERSNLEWNLGLKFSTNHSKVVSLGGLPTIVLGSSQRHKEGYPVGAVFEHNVVSAQLVSPGVVTNCLAEATPEQGGATVPCAQGQQVYRGAALPTWEGGVNTTLNMFRNFSLFARVDFQGGYTKVSGDLGASHLLFLNSLAALERTDPILVGMQTQIVGGNYTQAGVLEGGFAKFRELALTYTLPRGLAERMRAVSGTIGLSAYNLGNLWVAQGGTFGRKEFDPELNGQRTSEGDFSAAYQTTSPPASTIGFNLRLTY